MTSAKPPLRAAFEAERRKSAFMAFLPAMGAGVIASDTWLSPWAGVPGGFLLGGFAYGLVWTYETFMWRRHHGG